MTRRTTERIVRVVTEPLWRRDLLEMRAVDALVATFRPARRPGQRRAAPKPHRAPAKRHR